MDVLSHQRGLFTQALAGGDRECSAICNRSSGSTRLEFVARVSTPAPQLEVVSPHERHLIEKLTNVIEVSARELLEKL